MDNELYLWTIYDSEGRRIGLGVESSTEYAEHRGKEDATILSGTYKVWIAREIAVETTKKT